jgi:hypothetical protein
LGKLVKLTVPLQLFIRYRRGQLGRLADGLPKNIEHVIFTDEMCECKGPIWEWEPSVVAGVFEDWLSDWKSVTPHLKRVELKWFPSLSKDVASDERGLEPVENVFKKSGVDYIIHVFSHRYYRISNEEHGETSASVSRQMDEAEPWTRYRVYRPCQEDNDSEETSSDEDSDEVHSPL